MSDLKKINLENLQHENNAWLELPRNLHVDDIIHPWTQFSEWDKEHMDLFVGKLLTNPDFLYITCKILLNVTVFPMQGAVLRELWNRPFPMLIASRGFSKSFVLSLLSLLKCVLNQNIFMNIWKECGGMHQS